MNIVFRTKQLFLHLRHSAKYASFLNIFKKSILFLGSVATIALAVFSWQLNKYNQTLVDYTKKEFEPNVIFHSWEIDYFDKSGNIVKKVTPEGDFPEKYISINDLGQVNVVPLVINTGKTNTRIKIKKILRDGGEFYNDEKNNFTPPVKWLNISSYIPIKLPVTDLLPKLLKKESFSQEIQYIFEYDPQNTAEQIKVDEIKFVCSVGQSSYETNQLVCY